jgi:hypothetical protein
LETLRLSAKSLRSPKVPDRICVISISSLLLFSCKLAPMGSELVVLLKP